MCIAVLSIITIEFIDQIRVFSRLPAPLPYERPDLGPGLHFEPSVVSLGCGNRCRAQRRPWSGRRSWPRSRCPGAIPALIMYVLAAWAPNANAFIAADPSRSVDRGAGEPRHLPAQLVADRQLAQSRATTQRDRAGNRQSFRGRGQTNRQQRSGVTGKDDPKRSRRDLPAGPKRNPLKGAAPPGRRCFSQR
jgi:hypothetical protein